MSTRFRRKVALTAIVAMLGSLAFTVLFGGTAHADQPQIVNSGSAQWLESLAVSDGTASGRATGRNTTVSFVVKHDPDAAVTGLAIDDDWDGDDDTATVAPKTGVIVQTLPGLDHSRVTYTWSPPRPSDVFGCTIGGNTTRRADLPLRVAVATSDGQRTAPVARTVHIVEDDDCGGIQDYVHVWNQSQTATAVTPGASVSFTFTADDRDIDCWTAYRWRTRNLNTGAVSGTSDVNFTSCQDNTSKTQAVSFPSRGRFVVEVMGASGACAFGSCSRDYQDSSTTGWWRLGAVDVNTAAATSPTASVSAPGSAVVGSAFTATATVADGADAGNGGRAQVIEWDTDDDGAYDTQVNAANPAAGLSAGELAIEIDTTTAMPGPFTVRARVTDNGAMSAADNIRRQKVATTVVTLTNEAPTADDQEVESDEDTAVDITLTGSDPDGHALTFAVADGPAHGSLSGDAPEVTYSPDPDYFGSDEFTFVVDDGYGGTDEGTVSITVHPVNDAPIASDLTAETDEDTAVEVVLEATDVDNDVEDLTFSIVDGPSSGTVELDGDTVTYTPGEDFFGGDAFSYVANDGDLDSDVATVDVTVNAVNDAPVASARSATTRQETPVEVVLEATDVDNDAEDLTFSIVDGPSSGTVELDGDTVTYTPGEDFVGGDSFTYVANDGDLDSDAATVTITVDPLIGTTLAVNPAVAQVTGAKAYLTLSANLSEIESENGVSGVTVTFTVGPDVMCTAVTDAKGDAACGGVVAAAKAALAGEYTATSPKSPPHAGASGTGDIVRL